GDAALDGHERSSSVRAFAPYRCDGGKTKRVWNHGMGSGFRTVPSGTKRRLTQNIHFRGPKKRRDTLTVTVSGVTHNHSTSGSSQLEVTVNGRPMRPTEFGLEVPFSANTGVGAPDAHTLQFCRKVNRGKKRVRVRLEALGGDVHVEGALVHAELNN
ncbi:MAG: hypothetical protein L0K86_10175, partial [Actinomycetia bacterium]|nr:hypothetical protein [Actinomycetes bacterium]